MGTHMGQSLKLWRVRRFFEKSTKIVSSSISKSYTKIHDNFFGKSDEKWDWENFKSTKNFPVSEELMDWIIGQERAITECKLCIDEWIAKLLYLKKKEWWKAFENPMGHKPQSKEMLPAGPFLLMLGDAGCLIGDERIALRDGTFDKLENLGQTHLQDIHVPLFQYGKMSEKYRGTAEVFHRYENQPVMEVITESGKRIVGTYNHPLLTKEGWKRLDQLTKTDYLRVVTKIPCWKKNYYGFIDEKIGGLLGYALADGGIDKYALTLYISNKEQDLIPKLQSIIRESFNEEPNLWVRKAHGVNRTIDMNILEIDRKWVAEKLSFLKEKRVPIGIIQSPDSVVASFLSWFFTGDGSVFSKGKGHYAITAEQSEERIELLRDIQILLLRFGIYSIVKGRHLKIQRGKSIERFAKYIGFQTKEKQEKLMGLVVYVSGRRQKHNQLWERVISIKPMGITTVYDVEVPYHHHFIANGIVSHNTGKSLLGRAMTNYMTEIYKKNGIKLTDIVAWKNPSVPQEPKISIHPTPTGKEIIMKATKAVKKKSFLSRWGLKLVQGFMIGLGLVLTFISFYWIFAPWITNADFAFGQSIQEYYGGNFMSYLMSTLPPLAPLLGIGVTMMFSGIFIGIIGKMMGNVGNNQEGIGGASSSKAPKLLVDNSSERAPFIDACLLPETMVWMTQTLRNDYKVGESILNREGYSQKIINVERKQWSGKIVRIKPRLLPETIITQNHPILTQDHGWVKAGELKSNDILIIQIPKLVNYDIPEDLAWLFGIYLAEGYVKKEGFNWNSKKHGEHWAREVGFTLGFHEKEFADRIKTLFKKYYNYELKEDLHNEREIQLVCYSANLNRFFRNSFGESALLKHIPQDVFIWNELGKRAFLKGYWDGDRIDSKRNGYATASKQLFYDLIALHLSLGEIPSTHIRTCKGGVIRGRQISPSIQYSMLINNKEKAHYKQNGDKLLLPIRKVCTEDYNGEIINLETEDGIVPLPFITHNTGHGSSQLFGSIAWDPYQTGGLGTPEHQRCTAGDVHRAHLGILFIDEIKNLIGMEAITLLTVLEDGQLPIALRSQYHGGDSISGDSMIFFKDNDKPRYDTMKSLVGAFELGHKIEILSPSTMDFHTKSLMWTKVLNVYRRGIKPVKKLTLISGKQIELTEDHSLFSYNHRAKSLPLIPAIIKERNRFVTIEKIYELPIIDKTLILEEDLEFYGFWIADGSYDEGRRISLACGNDEIDKNFVKRYAYLRGVTASERKNGDVRIFSVEMVRKMQKLGFIGDSYTKRIPEWVFFLPKNKKERFISGYFRGDGCEYKKDGKMIIQFSSVNRKLLEDFQILFNTIGITSSIDGGRFNSFTSFKSIYRQYKLTVLLERERNQGILSLHRIRKLEDGGEKEVFDLKTENECFIANGILCHNTAAMAVATEPVPCMFFLVAAGNLDSLKQIHPALLDRIYGYGKVVYMNNEMSATPENRRKYIQFMAQEIKRFNLLPFSRDACIAIIEEAARRSGRNDQLTCKFRPMIGAIKTASVLARNEKCELVERKHVDEALSEHCKSIGLQVTEKLIERIKVYSHIDPKTKPKIGQIHGLAVSSINAESNDYVGSVLAIRASCVPKTGKRGEGYFHVTGVQTKDSSYVQHSISKVEHVINQLFNINLEHDFMTHVDFAQDHNVEGPSAGITMTLALISCLSKRRIYQNVAVTGEINIGCGGIGEDTIVITPIGGAHEKIMAAQNMGFKKVCIPKRNFEKNIDLSNYKIKIVGCTTLEDYIHECLEPEKKP